MQIFGRSSDIAGNAAAVTDLRPETPRRSAKYLVIKWGVIGTLITMIALFLAAYIWYLTLLSGMPKLPKTEALLSLIHI